MDKTKEALIEEINLLQKQVKEQERLNNEFRQEHKCIKLFAAVVHEANDAIIIQDLDGRITTWNRGAELRNNRVRPPL